MIVHVREHIVWTKIKICELNSMTIIINFTMNRCLFHPQIFFAAANICAKIQC